MSQTILLLFRDVTLLVTFLKYPMFGYCQLEQPIFEFSEFLIKRMIEKADDNCAL